MSAASRDPIATDALIIGAGPAGLFQAFQLGLHGIHSHLVDALPYVGGQCAELYADKLIYDIPAIPRCTGRELVDLLVAQVEPFGPVHHLGQLLAELQARPDGGFDARTASGTAFVARTVFLAAGLGAFVPRTLKLEGLAAFEGTQLFHHVTAPSADWSGARVVVVGSEDEAVTQALALAQAGAQVTLTYRRDQLQASAPVMERLQRALDAGALRFAPGLPQRLCVNGAGRLTGIGILTPQGRDEELPLDILWVLMGVAPTLGPLADWGLGLARKQVPVEPATFATEVPGLFAVGDVNTYPGKRRLILSAFHECTLAAFAAAERLTGGPVALEYTTSSTRLQGLLGVAPASAGGR